MLAGFLCSAFPVCRRAFSQGGALSRPSGRAQPGCGGKPRLHTGKFDVRLAFPFECSDGANGCGMGSTLKSYRIRKKTGRFLPVF